MKILDILPGVIR